MGKGELFILMTRLEARFTVIINGNTKADRFATNVAILHIFLEPHRTVDNDLNPLTAVWAHDSSCFQKTHTGASSPERLLFPS
jgi:hypothetical protein